MGQRRQASFGGVAALFGDEDGGPPVSSGPPSKSSKKRDPSFSGVANLFGDEEDEDEQNEEVQPNSSSDYGSSGQSDSVGALRELPKVNRTKKRDPSFGGVADLFKDDGGDDEEEENPVAAPKFEVKINPTQDKQISVLQTQVELSREKAIELEGE